MKAQTKSFGLYALCLERLNDLKEELHKEILPFPEVHKKLCPSFSIKKDKCWELLYLLREFGFIEIVKFHGIKLNSS